ncbi:hypothetical protein LI328DRAFT_30894 [Trichoderma asperelloides]|nr:hypothetical protein LI328DRAFT_30894 [Trichoderma asperelloides]
MQKGIKNKFTLTAPQVANNLYLVLEENRGSTTMRVSKQTHAVGEAFMYIVACGLHVIGLSHFKASPIKLEYW